MATHTKFETKTYEITFGSDEPIKVEVTQLNTACPSSYMVRVGNREGSVFKYLVAEQIAHLLTKQHSWNIRDYMTFARVHTADYGTIHITKQIQFKRVKVPTYLDEYTAIMLGGEEPIKSEPQISMQYALADVLRQYGL